MAAFVNIYEAKTQFSKLVERAESGEEIIIARSGKPVVRLAPLEKKPGGARLGIRQGQIRIHDDFDAPLPESIRLAFGIEDV